MKKTFTYLTAATLFLSSSAFSDQSTGWSNIHVTETPTQHTNGTGSIRISEELDTYCGVSNRLKFRLYETTDPANQTIRYLRHRIEFTMAEVALQLHIQDKPIQLKVNYDDTDCLDGEPILTKFKIRRTP